MLVQTGSKDRKMSNLQRCQIGIFKKETFMGDMTPAKIQKMIYCIREQKVMLDSDLAKLYGVETSALNRQIKRNADRFPRDFMFQLSKMELRSLRELDPIFKAATKRRKYAPYVFTEYGIAALSGVLNSKIAIKVNTSIIRTFIQMRKILSEDRSILQKIDELEKGSNKLFQIIFERLNNLENNTPSLPIKRRKIGLDT